MAVEHQPPSVEGPNNGDSDAEKGSSGTLNVGLDVVGDEAQPVDPEVARRVLRKIDWFLMPAMVIGITTNPNSYESLINSHAQATELCTMTRPFLEAQLFSA